MYLTLSFFSTSVRLSYWNSLLDSVGEGEGGMIWENDIEICIISYMKRVASSRFNARYWMLGAGALGRPRGMVGGGRREDGSGWGTCVYLWQIHFNIWQNQYNIVRFRMGNTCIPVADSF